jgi:hypothetical protein
MTSSTHTRLHALGDALEQAVRDDLHPRRNALNLFRPGVHLPRRLRSRRVALLAAGFVVIVPGGAIAATQLLTGSQVAASLPAGTLALVGTHPTCTVVTAGVEYHCTLASPPSINGAPTAPASGSAGSPTTPAGSPTTPAGSSTTDAARAGDQAKAIATVPPNSLALKRALVSGHPVVVVSKHSRWIELIKDGRLIKLPVAAGNKLKATVDSAGTGPSTAPQVPAWSGTVEPSVDQTKHVNGGCRALNNAGTDWDCYLGEAAVKQQIIGQSFLGQYSPTPGVG